MSMKIVMASWIERCPIKSLEGAHYYEDGTCRCRDTRMPFRTIKLDDMRGQLEMEQLWWRYKA